MPPPGSLSGSPFPTMTNERLGNRHQPAASGRVRPGRRSSIPHGGAQAPFRNDRTQAAPCLCHLCAELRARSRGLRDAGRVAPRRPPSRVELITMLRRRPSSAPSSVRAARLSRSSFRFPHLGLWTHEGHPARQGHRSSSRDVSATHSSKQSKPRSAIPTPPAWPSYTKMVGRPVCSWTFVERPPMSHRSHIAKSGRREMSPCSAAWSAETSVGIVSIPASSPSGGENHTPSVS